MTYFQKVEKNFYHPISRNLLELENPLVTAIPSHLFPQQPQPPIPITPGGPGINVVAAAFDAAERTPVDQLVQALFRRNN